MTLNRIPCPPVFQMLLTVLLAYAVGLTLNTARAETVPSSSKRSGLSTTLSKPTLFIAGEFSVQLSLERMRRVRYSGHVQPDQVVWAIGERLDTLRLAFTALERMQEGPMHVPPKEASSNATRVPNLK